MVKRSYSRFWYIIGIISSIGLTFVGLQGIWDTQNLLSPPCFDLCSQIESIRNQYILLTVAFILSVFMTMAGMRSAERRDKPRQVAAKNNLDDGQLTIAPSSLGNADLSLPIIIRTRTTPRSFMQHIVSAWVITSLIVVLISIFAIRDSTVHSPNDYLALIIFSISFYIFMTALIVFADTMVRVKMKITEEGITIHSAGRNHRIYWRDAKLFARPPLTSDEKMSPQFEIASARSRIVWNFIPEQHGFLAGPQPTMPYTEYARIMEALPALITAKTGLPLYDLRAK